jgi:hypothetical protein
VEAGRHGSIGIEKVLVKDIRDVPQFHIIFHEILYKLYIHLNLFIPKILGYVTRLLILVTIFLFFFYHDMQNPLNCVKIKSTIYFATEIEFLDKRLV